jgi:hypothetical protein
MPNSEVLLWDRDESSEQDNVVTFRNKEELTKRLQTAQEEGKMPVIIDVSAYDKFFTKKADKHKTHELNHAICIDKIYPDGKIVVNNPWGPKDNWGTKEIGGSPASDKAHPAASIDEFFPATQYPSVTDLKHFVTDSNPPKTPGHDPSDERSLKDLMRKLGQP